MVYGWLFVRQKRVFLCENMCFYVKKRHFWAFYTGTNCRGKSKEKPQKSAENWLAILDEIRAKNREIILSYTEELELLDLEEIEKLNKQKDSVCK